MVKKRNLNINQLLFGENKEPFTQEEIENLKENKENKLMLVGLYLSPGDYHRFHAPFDFTVEKSIRIPGYLNRVDLNTITHYSKVYETNERVTLLGRSPLGRAYLSIVGARNVGSIDLKFDPSLKTNEFDFSIKEKEYENTVQKAGFEIGKFNMGSTIVLLVEVPKNQSQ